MAWEQGLHLVFDVNVGDLGVVSYGWQGVVIFFNVLVMWCQSESVSFTLPLFGIATIPFVTLAWERQGGEVFTTRLIVYVHGSAHTW